MCTNGILSNITSFTYTVLLFLIPIGYILLYVCKNKKRKHMKKVLLIALFIFIILFLFKTIVKLDNNTFKCLNCMINNICVKDKKIEEDKVNKDIESTTKVENTTTTTTKETTRTKTTVKTTSKNNTEYDKVKKIDGEEKVFGKTSKGYTITEINGVTYIDGYMIVNKTYTVPNTFAPTNTHSKADAKAKRQCASCIDNTAYKAWIDMKSDAAALGLNIYISSGFRSYVTQSNIYNNNVRKNGKEKADTYSARPGSSEHQTGLCFDLNTIDEAFGRTDAGKWVAKNAYKYGYIIRYPAGKQNETGYIYESWHLRYVGSELAEKLYNNGNWITMESYFGITSQYKD